jgi:biopolymer transport protein ExbD
MSRLPAVATMILLSISCSQGKSDAGHATSSTSTQEVAKVRVYTDGKLTLDGQPVTIDALRSAFASLKKKNGVVWYYREQGGGAAHPTARQVMEAVMAAKLPISFSDREDFANVGAAEGQAGPK